MSADSRYAQLARQAVQFAYDATGDAYLDAYTGWFLTMNYTTPGSKRIIGTTTMNAAFNFSDNDGWNRDERWYLLETHMRFMIQRFKIFFDERGYYSRFYIIRGKNKTSDKVRLSYYISRRNTADAPISDSEED
jgi:hypothetical protein